MYSTKMAKLFLALLIASAAVLIQGSPLSAETVEQAAAGNWNAIHKLITRDTGSEDQNTDQGVPYHFGQSVSSFYSSTNNNGKVEKKGQVVELVDNNGQITKRVYNLP